MTIIPNFVLILTYSPVNSGSKYANIAFFIENHYKIIGNFIDTMKTDTPNLKSTIL